MSNEKLLNEFKQDLLGFVSQLANGAKNQANIFANYDQLFKSTYQDNAALKALATKKAMSGIPTEVDPRVAAKLGETIDQENKNNQTSNIDYTPKTPGNRR